MQNRVDEAQMRVHGYRDRISHVSMSKDEGGMNLTMPAERITSLTARGRAAARRLLDAYTPPDPEGDAITWDNHRWVRLRSSLAVLEQMNSRFAEGYSRTPDSPDERLYEELFADPPSYEFNSAAHSAQAAVEIAAILAIPTPAEPRLSSREGAPRPIPEGRISPRE
ncbi:MAG: hypothetical protein ACREJT_07855, partial [Myxococcota bacterium]